MKISLIIPVYNTERYIQDAIESALNQTYADIEIIAVNDGSTDNSLKILERYSNKIKIITKQNGGTASALNIGINTMSGNWFKWLGADDILYPSSIEELVNAAKEIQDKNTILYSNYDIIDVTGKIIRQFIEPNYNKLENFERHVILLDHFFGNAGTTLIHKSIFDKYGLYDETIGFQEDYELWLRLCIQHNCTLHLIPKILLGYRVHENQLTKKNTEINLGNAERIRKIVLNRLDPELQERYKIALIQYKKKKPWHVKSRHMVKDTMLKILPRSISESILKLYTNTREEHSGK